MSEVAAYTFEDRELSWLSFNERVLQEARDRTVPIYERLFFLGIFSSNLDEFYRVRVASLRSLLRLKEKAAGKLDFNPHRLLGQIRHRVVSMQEEFGRTLAGILQELEDLSVAAVRTDALNSEQAARLREYFDGEVRPHLTPVMLTSHAAGLFLRDRGLYLVVELWPLADASDAAASDAAAVDGRAEPEYALVEVPSPPLPRFVTLPSEEGGPTIILFLDDVIRMNLPRLFDEYEVGDAYAVKLSRDAELYLDEDDLTDEFARGMAKLIRKSLSKRETGLPCRFLYDRQTPFALLERLKNRLGLDSADLVIGGRYHNLNDLMGFPRLGAADLSYEPMPPLPHPELEGVGSLLAAVAAQDHIVHVPYQKFDYVTRFLEEAAADPAVEAVWITLYRVAKDSAVVDALIRAAEAGKNVTAFVEAKARFDEARNLESADRMEAAGVNVLHSMPKLKVHAKVALVERREPVGGTDAAGRQGAERLYAYLGTGNFNERTAAVYSDVGLFTADSRLTEEVRRVFNMLAALVEGENAGPDFEHLLVAPHAMRRRFYELIDAEIEHASKGDEAWMLLKMNSLEDPKMIQRLYQASQAGVRIRIVVRGICCLVPGVEGQSENIEVTSILDRCLEHARFYAFANGGQPLLYLASADWMRRNLSRRVEVGFPIYEARIRAELFELFDLQIRDNRKARIIDREQRNDYFSNGRAAVQAQVETYRRFQNGRAGA